MTWTKCACVIANYDLQRRVGSSTCFQFPGLKTVTHQASFELSANLLPRPVWLSNHGCWMILNTERWGFLTRRMIQTQMKWGWYRVGQQKRPRGKPPCTPCWVWILVNADEVAAPKPPPSCCCTAWFLQAYDGWVRCPWSSRKNISLHCPV